MRSRLTANAKRFGSRESPGAIRYTICGANHAASRAARLRMRVTRLIREDASLQADVRSLFTRKAVNVGRKAEPSAPAAINVKSVSETRFAAAKASSSAAGNALATRMLRTSPISWLKRIASITAPAARAIWRFAFVLGVVTARIIIHRTASLVHGTAALVQSSATLV